MRDIRKNKGRNGTRPSVFPFRKFGEGPAMQIASYPEIVRPVLRLAAIAFMAGFLGYLAVGGAGAIAQPERPHIASVSGPASEDWNFPKKI
jgi:hypothetical protein